MRDRRTSPELERQRADIEHWAGLWIAVKNGDVIAAATTSHDLVSKVLEMGAAGTGAVAQYVPARSDAIVIGVG